MEKFDIIRYLEGLTAFVFDRSVLERVARERGVEDATSLKDIDTKTRELLFADLLLTIYLSPNSTASFTKQHGSFTQTVGSQTINDKKGIYKMFVSIYRKWNDDKLETVGEMTGGLSWME